MDCDSVLELDLSALTVGVTGFSDAVVKALGFVAFVDTVVGIVEVDEW